jgi:hypothetical protein
VVTAGELHGRQGKIFLAFEIVIERALGHTGGIHDLLDAGAVISFSQHQRRTGVEDGCTLIVFGRLHAAYDMTGRLYVKRKMPVAFLVCAFFDPTVSMQHGFSTGQKIFPWLCFIDI